MIPLNSCICAHPDVIFNFNIIGTQLFIPFYHKMLFQLLINLILESQNVEFSPETSKGENPDLLFSGDANII